MIRWMKRFMLRIRESQQRAVVNSIAARLEVIRDEMRRLPADSNDEYGKLMIERSKLQEQHSNAEAKWTELQSQLWK